MIRIQLGDRLLGLGFEHKSINEVIGDDLEFTTILGRRVKKTIETRNTYCTIYELTPSKEKEGKFDAVPLAKGHARCSPLDNFNKEEGRKVSLSKALKVLWPGIRELTFKKNVLQTKAERDAFQIEAATLLENQKQREEVWKGYHSRWVSDAIREIEQTEEHPEVS